MITPITKFNTPLTMTNPPTKSLRKSRTARNDKGQGASLETAENGPSGAIQKGVTTPFITGRGYSYYINLQNTILDRQLGSNGRGSWRGRHILIATARDTARLKLLEALDGKQLEKPVMVVCRRYYSGRAQAMDVHDNLRACFKPYVDGIAAALWPDLATGRGDDADHMVIEYQQRRAEKGTNYLEFEVRPIPQGSYCYLSDRQKALIGDVLCPGVLDGVRLDYSAAEIAELRNYIQAMLSVKEYVKP